MNIRIRVKAAGKRKPLLELQSQSLPDGIDTIEKLITTIVTKNVREYNTKIVDASLFRYLTETELQNAVEVGKVGFNHHRNKVQQDENQAVLNALQCFEDGLYRIIINETEITENQIIELQEGDILTFIRLTMLAGRRF